MNTNITNFLDFYFNYVMLFTVSYSREYTLQKYCLLFQSNIYYSLWYFSLSNIFSHITVISYTIPIVFLVITFKNQLS